MILLVSGATKTLKKLGLSLPLGRLITPRCRSARNVEKLGLPWAADNGAFSGFKPAEFMAMIKAIAGKPGCLFVVVPDVVADAAATMELFCTWGPVVTSFGLPVAFVIQDGQTLKTMPWKKIRAVFIGGTTEFKLSKTAAAITREARRRNLWVHMGRVNSLKRIKYAHRIGCSSVDGSGYSRWPDIYIPRACRYIQELDGQMKLFSKKS